MEPPPRAICRGTRGAGSDVGRRAPNEANARDEAKPRAPWARCVKNSEVFPKDRSARNEANGTPGKMRRVSGEPGRRRARRDAAPNEANTKRRANAQGTYEHGSGPGFGGWAPAANEPNDRTTA